jgi:hypothetical protein
MASTSATRGIAARWYMPESGMPRRPAPGRGRAVRSDGRKGSSVSAMENPPSHRESPRTPSPTREISRDVDCHAAGVLQLIPQLVRLIEFEIRIARVIGDLPRRDRNRYDRHSRKTLSYEIADLFGGRDLHLRRESLSHVFRGTIRSRGKMNTAELNNVLSGTIATLMPNFLGSSGIGIATCVITLLIDSRSEMMTGSKLSLRRSWR